MSRASRRGATFAATAVVALLVSGCARSAGPAPAVLAALVREARPVGRGARFESRARGPVLEPCRARLGRRTETHVEVFAENRVVLIPEGIGVRSPIRGLSGRIRRARCYGRLVTTDPTGVVLSATGDPSTLAELFGSWGTTLTRRRLAGFAAAPGARVRVYVDGRARAGDPGAIRLAPGAEIVLEVGPHVPPHRAYAFPPEP